MFVYSYIFDTSYFKCFSQFFYDYVLQYQHLITKHYLPKQYTVFYVYQLLALRGRNVLATPPCSASFCLCNFSICSMCLTAKNSSCFTRSSLSRRSCNCFSSTRLHKKKRPLKQKKQNAMKTAAKLQFTRNILKSK